MFIRKTSDTDYFGRITRSLDAFRPLTFCNFDCKVLTSAISRGLHWYTMQCIHPPQRCISSRQMTDNIFEIEISALAQIACAPTDFAAAYLRVNHCWIFSVLENTGLPDCLRRFLRSISRDSITHLEFAGAERGQFPHGQKSTTRLSCECFFFYKGLRPYLPMAPRINYPKKRRQIGVLAAYAMCIR